MYLAEILACKGRQSGKGPFFISFGSIQVCLALIESFISFISLDFRELGIYCCLRNVAIMIVYILFDNNILLVHYWLIIYLNDNIALTKDYRAKYEGKSTKIGM